MTGPVWIPHPTQAKFKFPTPGLEHGQLPQVAREGGYWSFQLFKEKQVYFTYSGKVWTPIYKSHIVFCKPGKQLQAVLRKKMKWKGTFVLTNIHQTMPDVGTTVYKSLPPAKVTGTASPATFIINKCWWKISTEKHQRNSYSSHFPVIEWNWMPNLLMTGLSMWTNSVFRILFEGSCEHCGASGALKLNSTYNLAILCTSTFKFLQALVLRNILHSVLYTVPLPILSHLYRLAKFPKAPQTIT